MNNCEARAALREWGAATTQIVLNKQRLKQAAELAETAMLLDKYGSGGGRGPSEQSLLLRQEIDRVGQETEFYLRQKRRMDEFVNSLPLLYQQLLGLRYIEGRKWTYIARKLNYAEASARRFESEALRLLQKRQ